MLQTQSDSTYEFDTDSMVLVRHNPRNNIVRPTGPDLPPFEGPQWKVRSAVILPTQAIFHVGDRPDPLVTTALTGIAVLEG
jgi:hypothetical protein